MDNKYFRTIVKCQSYQDSEGGKQITKEFAARKMSAKFFKNLNFNGGVMTKKYIINKEDYESLVAFAETDATREELKDRIKKLNVSKEDKAALYELSGAQVNWKGKIIHIGLRIVEVTLNVVRKYPATVAAGIVGLTLFILLSNIPIIGQFVGMVLALVIVGLGLMQDLGYQVRTMLRAETNINL